MPKSKNIDLETGRVFDWNIDKGLLVEAFTHPNYLGEHPDDRDYERLEFLGDAVLDLLTSEWLFLQTTEEEGIMSQLRSLIVKDETLTEVGQELGIAEHLRTYSRYQVVETDLEDVVEAIFGAFYLSEGKETTKLLFQKLFEKKLQGYKNDLQTKEGRERILEMTVCEKNPINVLQEHFQQNDLELPDYDLIKTSGTQHDPKFHMVCKVRINSEVLTTNGEGSNKKSAKKDAAEKMILKLGLA